MNIIYQAYVRYILRVKTAETVRIGSYIKFLKKEYLLFILFSKFWFVVFSKAISRCCISVRHCFVNKNHRMN
jgi:hypothetical protein